ncbi:hypothetical protein AXX12_07635 [Anaerosporomusa subterranea]|uniref:DUF2179 domain-containing protein n=1 Tax=Anaerosporomusa subterranea TaxID=1794912 RepID=A0A154BR45_ANASB|nr:YitT family protein [Anaerosporomusa subterranea]KYZ76300.1 hypothetical protein AXX12_07635 [Anaerosporomusa subterranea]
MQQKIWRYALVGLGSIICGAGINAFLVPHHMLSGGISGVAMIFYFLFNWPIGLLVAIGNIPVFYLGYKLLDREFLIGALYGLAVFSLSIDATRFLANMNLVDDIILAAVFGGVISGIGSGIIFRVGGSTGGTDIIAVIVKKYYSYNIGFVSFSINLVVMAVAAFLFGLKPAMYTLISMFIGSSVTDKVIEGFNRKKTILIISDLSEEIAAAILNEIGRGVTFLKGEGAYTRNDKKVVFVVVTLTQIARIKFIVEKVDPNAFMIVQDAAEVMGRGFSVHH